MRVWMCKRPSSRACLCQVGVTVWEVFVQLKVSICGTNIRTDMLRWRRHVVEEGDEKSFFFVLFVGLKSVGDVLLLLLLNL